ncbi:MAG: Phytoene synthase [Rhizobium sp.]|nr:Phytoene synthase [Rhizobium sp.]
MSLDRSGAYEACLATLRTTDIDRYLACLLMPEERRGAVAALYAFNAELARIRDIIREPLPGEIRLQWWRDMLEGEGEGDSLANPLAAGLIHAIDEHSLPRQPLVAMTEARIFDLYDDPVDSTAMFEGYAGETASALIQLTAMILDPEHAQKASDAAGHAGIAQLVAGSLLLLPTHMRRHQVYVPGDILAATGLTAEAFLRGGDRPRIGASLSAFIGFGRDHLRKARQASVGTMTPEASLAFLPIASVEGVLDRAGKLGADILTTSPQQSQLRRQWNMWRASRKRRF